MVRKTAAVRLTVSPQVPSLCRLTMLHAAHWEALQQAAALRGPFDQWNAEDVCTWTVHLACIAGSAPTVLHTLHPELLGQLTGAVKQSVSRSVA